MNILKDYFKKGIVYMVLSVLSSVAIYFFADQAFRMFPDISAFLMMFWGGVLILVGLWGINTKKV